MAVYAHQTLTAHLIIARMDSVVIAETAAALPLTVRILIRLILYAMLLAPARDIETIKHALAISAALLLILMMTAAALMDYYLIAATCMFLFFAMDSRHKAIHLALAHAHLIRNVIPMHTAIILVWRIFQMDYHVMKTLTVYLTIARMGSAAEAGIAAVLLQTALIRIRLILYVMLLAHAKATETTKHALATSAELLLILTMTVPAPMDY